MNRCWQIVGDYGTGFHAGPKAQCDVTSILNDMGWRPFYVKRCMCRGFLGKLYNRLAWAVKCWWLRSRLPSACTLFMQFPSAAWSASPMLCLLNEKTKRRKKIRFVVLIHDLASLRWSEDAVEKGELASDESSVIETADVVIVHNAAMKEALVRRGVPEKKMVELGIFDYMTPDDGRMDRVLSNEIAIAGNLNPDKAGYLDGLASISDVNWNLYGVQFNSEHLKGDNVRFKGCYAPDDLPVKIEGSFGLVWDGRSIECCAGALGNYLRINNPHKLSLYLASGLPVFIWEGAAEATFVKAHDVGICLGSISEIPDIINSMTTDRYQQLVRNVAAQSKLLRNGHFLKMAIKQAIYQGE